MAILDQINVKESEQDPTGVDYDIRDRELHTATGQSTVNTSDVVLLKDTSGKYHEITKDSFMSAVRGALGSLIKGYDKGTAINGIAVTGSAGTVNDLGFSSPSDLASVLGVIGWRTSVYGPGFMAAGGSGLYLFGAYSTDLTEYSCYIGTYYHTVFSPTSYAHRLDNGDKCVINSNSIGTLAVDNPTSGKSYMYYYLKLGNIS